MESYQNLAVNKRQTPQKEQAQSTQVKNNADGYVFALDDWKRLDRFLILGSSSNTYYQNAKDITKENLTVIQNLLDLDGVRVVKRIVEISDSGRAPKNDPAIFLLAMAAGHSSENVRREALRNLSNVCRIPTHLFSFLTYLKLFRGRGKLIKQALQNWYMSKNENQLVFHLLKYRQRDGWTNRDVLRLCKPAGADGVYNTMFAWVTGKDWSVEDEPEMLSGFIKAQEATNEKVVADLITNYGLTREMIPTQFLKSKVIWEALLEKMPMTALIRNLGNMGACGLLTPLSTTASEISKKIVNEEALEKARIHPMAILYASKTYEMGHGFRGSNNWPVCTDITDALDDAFYLAFDYVEPINKRYLVGIDVSGSMGGGWWERRSNELLNPREVAAAMSVIHSRIERDVHYIAFSHVLIPLSISRKSTINSAIRETSGLNFGATDCALPMLYALEHNVPVDCFIVYTDNETWFGDIHPFQALKMYRDRMGINAKLVVCGITSTGFSIADPNDPGMLDVVGFDAAVPNIISDFVKND